MRKRLFVEEMAELLAKVAVLVVRDFQQTIFNAKRFPVVLLPSMAGNFRRPAIEIFAVEQLPPLALLLGFLRVGSRMGEGHEAAAREKPQLEFHFFSAR
jgi:hypothetical protein